MSEPECERSPWDTVIEQLHREAFGPDGEVVDDLKYQAIIACVLVSRAVGRHIESLPEGRRKQVTLAEAWAALDPMLREAVRDLARQGLRLPVGA
jgi:hypothetical protein